MEAVPKEAYWIGMAGVVPYMATSLSTVYAAWELNNVFTTGSGALMNEKTAELMLQILEPIQIGYGAAVCTGNMTNANQRAMLTIPPDHLLHQCHPLGTRVRRLRWSRWLQALQHRCVRYRRCIGHHPHAH